MPKPRRISLDWRKLFAFDQTQQPDGTTRPSRLSSRLGEKIGGKECSRPQS
jgi:hypothetical protein